MIDRDYGVTLPGALSPLARAVLDSLSEGVVLFDTSARGVYLNAAARRALGSHARDLRPRLVELGARFTILKNGTQSLGEAAFLPPPSAARTLAERERQAILDTLLGTSGKLAETARLLGISRTTLWRRLKAYGLDRFRAPP